MSIVPRAMRRCPPSSTAWRRGLVGLVGLVGFVLGLPTADPARADDRAWTYRTLVTADDLDDWLRYATTETGTSIDRDGAARQLILVQTLAHEARRLGLHRKPEVRIALDQARGRLAVQALRRHVDAEITVSSDAVEAKALQIAATYALPRRVRLRNLFKRFPVGASAADVATLRRQMEQLRRRVLDGADFATLAKTASDSHTRYQGGLIGNVQPGTLRPSVDRVAMSLRPGEVSEVLEEPEGLTLLFCERVIERRQYTDDQMRDNAERLLTHQAWRRAWAAMEAHLLDRAAATWHWQALDVAERPIEGSAVLVEVLGDRLTVDAVRALVTPRGSLDALASLDRTTIQQRAEPFFRQLMAIREVVTLGLDDEGLSQRMRWSRLKLLAAQATAEHVARRLDPVRDADADALARAEPERFVRPEHLRLAVIALPFDAADPRPAFALAERLESSLDAGDASFDELARRHSVDASAADGGELPVRPRVGLAGRLGIDAARAIRELIEPGARSGWVRDDERSVLWWIELRGIEPARPMTADEAREPARRRIGQQRVEALEGAFVAEWLAHLDLRPIDADAGSDEDADPDD